jgi:EmrB/QacA subfamily drug resistance transporter
MADSTSTTQKMNAQQFWTMVAVVLGSGIVFLDSTVVTVALPKIAQDLPSHLFAITDAQLYVYTFYLLSLSSLLILAGALSDYYGRRRTFALGLVGFGAFSLACGLAPNMEMLLLFRVLQGAAGALLVPGSLSIITATFEGEQQGRAFGIWAGASAATTILGPFVGGVLVDTISWRAAFLINVPLVILGYYACARYVAESRDEEASSRFDWVGAAVVFLAVGGLAFGATRGQQREWHDATAFIALGIGGAATLAFPILMLRSSHPLVPPDLFRSRNFTVTNISTLLIYGALYVMFFFVVIFAEGTLGYNARAAGLIGIPGSLFLVLFSTRVGRLAVRYGPRIFMSVGPAIMGLGILWFVRMPAESAAWVFGLSSGHRILPPGDYLTDLLPGFTIFGIGLVVMVAPLTTALMRSVPKHKAGVASAVNNAISRVGPQLAGAVIFVAIVGSFYHGLSARVPSLDVSSQDVRKQIAPLNQPTGKVSPRVANAVRSSSTHSFRLAMVIAAGLLFAGAAVNAVGIRNPQRAVEEAGEEAAPGGLSPPASVPPVPGSGEAVPEAP